MRDAGYDNVSKWLHWLVAAMVLAQFATGWIWGYFERGSEPRFYLFRTHLVIGTAVLVLAIGRVAWRFTHAAPPLRSGLGRPAILAARATHGLLYLAILVQPILGLLTVSAFGKSLGTWPRMLHAPLSYVIAGIVVLHVAAALWHHFVRRDEVLRRMLPARVGRYAAVALLGLALCGTGMDIAAAEIRVTDLTGRNVVLPAPAKRMLIDDGRYLIALSLIHSDPVSLVAAWPKDINRIGKGVYEQYRAKFPAIEHLQQTASSAGTFSVEQVLSAAPDLAIFSLQSAPSPQERKQIESAGIPVVIIDFFNNPLKNLEPSLRLLGAVTGRDAEAEAFIAARQDRMDAIATRLAGAAETRRPRVFLEPHAARTNECCASPGRGNIGDYIEFAGGENIGAAAIPGAFGTLNLEYVIAADPEVYIATGGPHMEGTGGLLIGPEFDEATVQATLSRVAARSGISGLSAVRAGRVHGLSHQLINSPLDILALEALAKWIRPDLFGDLDVDETRRELNERFLAVPIEGIYWADLD